MRNIIVVDRPERWPLRIPDVELVPARTYLTDTRFAECDDLRVFNMCRSQRYQTTGYYVSLLASARGHRPLPSIATLQDLRLAPVLRVASHELDDIVQRSLQKLRGDEFELSIYFGRNLSEHYDRLALAIFNQFPAPFLRASFERSDGRWELDNVRVIGGAEIPESHRAFVVDQAKAYFKHPHRRRRTRGKGRYDLAILADPAEKMPPSNKGALKKFAAAAESVGFRVETVTREDYGRIAVFDALFIRETTRVDHHTFRLARLAAAEGLIVIDDPDSILRCTNKVFLTELMQRHRVPIPRSLIIAKDQAALVGERIGFPCVFKQPDGSFSFGVEKIESQEAFEAALPRLFAETDLLLAQEFVPTSFDWRIGVLDGEPLYACMYHMARKHWQIYHHHGGKSESGAADTFAVEDAPKRVVGLAVRAAKLMGDGLYGVDLKVVHGKPVVIEVNDNPSIDAGVEDKVLGDRLYERIMRKFLERVEARRR